MIAPCGRIQSPRIVASQHPLRIGQDQSPRISSDFILAFPHAVALLKALRIVASQHPLRIGRTQSPLKTSTELMFLLFLLLADLQEQALDACSK
jgi:hypothetical protein